MSGSAGTSSARGGIGSALRTGRPSPNAGAIVTRTKAPTLAITQADSDT
jgi:hypothetical protein